MKKILFVVFFCTIMSITALAILAEESESTTEQFYAGVDEMTDEELDAFHSSLPRIVDVKPNKYALSRLSEDESALFENIGIANPGEEMVYAMQGEDVELMSATTEFSLTSEVDVSESLTFPPMGNQGSTLACVPWTLCYYQLTNNNNLVRGLQAKNESGEAVPENIMAPGFIYSLCNGGVNTSTNWIEVTEALVGYGCPNICDYALRVTGESLQKWCTDTDVWYNAAYNKPEGVAYIKIDVSQIINADSNCVQLIKEMLSNGYVVSFSTFANSFEVTQCTTTGEYACRYMTDTQSGGHAMTIVGYNDDFWVDINGDGDEDSGEKGAFRVINSIGTKEPDGYYDEFASGYLWMPYDAMGNVSGVEGAALNRMPIMKKAVYFLVPQKNYVPLLMAEVEITTAKRNDVVVSLGVSDIESSEPEYYVSPIPDSNKCAAFYKAAEGRKTGLRNISYSGGENIETAVIPFDLTNAIKQIYKDNKIDISQEIRFYVKIEDCLEENGYPVTLGDIILVEPLTGKRTNCTNTTSIVAEASGAVKHIDFDITAYIGHDKQQNISVVFSNNIRKDSLKDNVYMISPDGEKLYLGYEVDENHVVLLAPENGYESDSKYELHIKPGIQSLGGNLFENEYVTPVYVLGELFYNDMAKLEDEVGQ